eukprot:scaffold2351_cov403-Prasinococcus_capsulatus_cf.AAC.6
MHGSLSRGSWHHGVLSGHSRVGSRATYPSRGLRAGTYPTWRWSRRRQNKGRGRELKARQRVGERERRGRPPLDGGASRQDGGRRGAR